MTISPVLSPDTPADDTFVPSYCASDCQYELTRDGLLAELREFLEKFIVFLTCILEARTLGKQFRTNCKTGYIKS